MKNEHVERESQRVRELADEYTKKGYAVVHPRSESDIPQFLRGQGYLPDLVATSNDECLVIEVKTARTVREDKKISRVSELVNRQPGWQFLFVLTNPKERTPAATVGSSERWQELLRTSRHPALQTEELSEAAFILAWGALEGALREASSTSGEDDPIVDGKPVPAKSPLSQIRDAAILGLIDRKDIPKLERLFAMRNSIVHSGSGPRPTLEEVRDLQRFIDDVIRIARSHEV